MSRDRLTTLLGAVLAALAATNIDYVGLLSGDWRQVSTAIAVVIVAIFGYLTNKPDRLLTEADAEKLRAILQKVVEKRLQPKGQG